VDGPPEKEATGVALTDADESAAHDSAAAGDKKCKGRKYRKGSKALMGALKQINIDEDGPTKTVGVKKKKIKKKVLRKKSRAATREQGENVEVQDVQEEEGLHVLDEGRGTERAEGKTGAAENSVLDLFALPDSNPYPFVGATPVVVHITIDHYNNDDDTAAVVTERNDEPDGDGDGDDAQPQREREKMHEARNGSLRTKTTKKKNRSGSRKGHQTEGDNNGRKGSGAKVGTTKRVCRKKPSSSGATKTETADENEVVREPEQGKVKDGDHDDGALVSASCSGTDEDDHAKDGGGKSPSQDAATDMGKSASAGESVNEGEGDGVGDSVDDSASSDPGDDKSLVFEEV
jgi:hypothetical protein